MEKDIHDRLDRARAITRENVERAASGLKHGAQALGTRAKAATSNAGKRMQDVREQAGKAAGEANRLITEHPLAAVAAAAAVGALAAHLFLRKQPQPEDAAEVTEDTSYGNEE